MTPSLALILIGKAFTEQATFLDLGNCNLTDIPVEIARLAPFLKELNFGNDYYKADKYTSSTNIGVENDFSNDDVNWNILQELSLTGLYLSRTKLLSPHLLLVTSSHSKLAFLDISNNQITDADAKNISKNLSQLVSLDIANNLLTDIGFQFIAQSLFQIKHLVIWGNNLTDVTGKHIAKHLLQLITLDIAKNKIMDFGIQLIVQNCTKLISLKVWNNDLTDKGVEHITLYLPLLTQLDISDNRLSDISANYIAQKLSHLTFLDISNNQLTDTGAKHLAKLPSLTSLWISNNQLTESGINLLMTLPKLDTFHGVDNKVDTIPETLLNDVKALKDHFKASRLKELVDNNFVKVILMGNTTSGKSSLANYLVDGTFADTRESTHGIKIWKWHTDPKNPANDLTVNIWDFGGQDYYHATHTLFRSAKTLFLFLHTDEETHEKSNPEDNQYLEEEYWLANIQSLAGDLSFAWFVQSKYEPNFTAPPIQRLFLNSEAAKTIIRNQFAISVKKAYENDTDSIRNFIYFQQSLTTELQKLATEKLQASWVEIRDKHLIEWRKKDLYLTIETFWEKCQTVFADSSSQNNLAEKPDILLKYLRDCGEIIWFDNNPELKDKIYLSVDQLTKNLFELLNKGIKTDQGFFVRSTLSNANKKVFDEYLKILLEFNLIFKKSGTNDTYVVPQYLPNNPYTIHFQQLIPISYVIKLTYLSRALFTRFLVIYANVDGNYYWQYGAFLRKGKFHLFVQMDAYQQTVSIHISEGSTREKYTILRELFQFFTSPEAKEQSSSQTFSSSIDEKRKLKASLSTKYKGNIQLSSDGTAFIPIADLENAISNNLTKVKSKDGAYVSISPVMHQLLTDGANTPKKVFLSYAHKDEVYKKELDTHFSALKRSGLIETWQDREIIAGEDWDKVIKDAIKQSDIVLLMLSPDFMASDYIWNTELPAAQGWNTDIIPLFIRPCDFDETQFGIYKGQGLPGYENARIRWIVSTDFPNRDEGYLKIVEGLKAKLKQS